MTRYTKRDLRAVDVLAMFLVGVGIVLALIALFAVVGSKGGADTLLLWIAAGSTLALGTALNLKVRRLIRTEGEEPSEYGDVAE